MFRSQASYEESAEDMEQQWPERKWGRQASTFQEPQENVSRGGENEHLVR